MSDAREVSVELLRTFTPLEGMKRENLHALAKKVTVKEMTAGRTLFKEGDTDKRNAELSGPDGVYVIGSEMMSTTLGAVTKWSLAGVRALPKAPR